MKTLKENEESMSNLSDQDPNPKPTPHPKLPQYSIEEATRAAEVMQLLIKVRDRCREQKLIDW